MQDEADEDIAHEGGTSIEFFAILASSRETEDAKKPWETLGTVSPRASSILLTG